jgi:photosystem II stability/assembly factor-like uncharacterized protein
MGKKLFIIILITFYSGNIIDAQFVQQNSGSNAILSEVDFVDSTHGWIIPWMTNYLLKTMDGGINWGKVYIPNNFNRLKFVDDKIGYALQGNGGLYKTTDAGNSWSRVSDSLSINMNGQIFTLDKNNIFFSSISKFYKSTDGGQTWMTYSFSETPQQYVGEEINDMCFIDNQIGYLLYFYDLFSTSDGGKTWIKIQSPKCKNIFFISKNVGYALSDNDIIKTEDAGKTWAAIGSVTDSANKIRFINDKVGFLLDWSFYKTTDAGLTWKQFRSKINLYDYSVVDENNIWICGDSGYVAKYNSKKTGNIKLIYPVGGEIFHVSDKINVIWSADYVTTSNLIIEILPFGYYNYEVPIQNGEAKIILPDIQGNYQLHIYDKNFPLNKDQSRDFIVKLKPDLAFYIPQGGEIWQADSTKIINITSYNVEYLKLEYSTNSGNSWYLIQDSIHADSNNIKTIEYSWKIPNTPSKECLLKVTSLDNPSVFKISDIFEINNQVQVLKSYFPLETSNYWQLKITYYNQLADSPSIGYGYMQVLNDTTIGTVDQVYKKVKVFPLPPYYDSVKYLRYDSLQSSIIEYSLIEENEQILFDLNNPTRELYKTIFDENKRCKIFNKSSIPILDYFLCAEIGPVQIYNDQSFVISIFTNYELVYAKINGKEFGKLVSVSDKNKNYSTTYSLSQNYPNPFNPITRIQYSIPKASLVILKVYDILGIEVTTLVNEEKPAGNYEVKFNGNDLPSGIYFYSIQTRNFLDTKKFILLK